MMNNCFVRVPHSGSELFRILYKVNVMIETLLVFLLRKLGAIWIVPHKNKRNDEQNYFKNCMCSNSDQ